MARRESNDCCAEILGTVFCRFRKASSGAIEACRPAIALDDVQMDLVQMRAERAIISPARLLFLIDAGARYVFPNVL
jgi:hypothetical protein